MGRLYIYVHENHTNPTIHVGKYIHPRAMAWLMGRRDSSHSSHPGPLKVIKFGQTNPNLLGCDIGGAIWSLGVIYFPTNCGAKEHQNLPNQRVGLNHPIHIYMAWHFVYNLEIQAVNISNMSNISNTTCWKTDPMSDNMEFLFSYPRIPGDFSCLKPNKFDPNPPRLGWSPDVTSEKPLGKTNNFHHHFFLKGHVTFFRFPKDLGPSNGRVKEPV